MGKEDFIMPLRYKSRFERWDSEKVKAILMAMFEYKETGEYHLPDDYLDAFDSIKYDMDIINAAYEEKCRINAENGAKGGRPKKANGFPETERFFQKPKKPDIDMDKDIDIDIDRDVDITNLKNKKIGTVDIRHISDILGG